MKFGGGVGIYKEDWEDINEKYEQLIKERVVLLNYLMMCSTVQITKPMREKIILNDDIIKEIMEERERMRIRVCNKFVDETGKFKIEERTIGKWEVLEYMKGEEE